ncbi:13668_t:CDS:2, partial [Cetraspora pellucida]
MSSLIPKRPKLLDTRTRKKDFDLSSEKEKTHVLEAEVESESYSVKDEPSKSNNKNVKSGASNTEQEGKPVGKGKQKAIPSTGDNNKAKSDKARVDVNTVNTENNKQTEAEHVHTTRDKVDTQDNVNDNTTSDSTDLDNKNMITEQNGPSTKVLEPNHSKKGDLINNANIPDSTSKENPNSASTLNQDSLPMEINHKDTDGETSATNLDQDVTMEPFDSDKENKAEEKEFTLVTSKKNNRKGNKKKNLVTSEDSNK